MWYSRARLTCAAPDPRLRRSVVSRPFAVVRDLVQTVVLQTRRGQVSSAVGQLTRKRKEPYGEQKDKDHSDADRTDVPSWTGSGDMGRASKRAGTTHLAAESIFI